MNVVCDGRLDCFSPDIIIKLKQKLRVLKMNAEFKLLDNPRNRFSIMFDEFSVIGYACYCLIKDIDIKHEISESSEGVTELFKAFAFINSNAEDCFYLQSFEIFPEFENQGHGHNLSSFLKDKNKPFILYSLYDKCTFWKKMNFNPISMGYWLVFIPK